MKQVSAWLTDDGQLFGDRGLAEAHEAQGAITTLGAATSANVAEALQKAHAGEPRNDLEAAIDLLAGLFWSARNSVQPNAPQVFEATPDGGVTAPEQVTSIEAQAADAPQSGV